MVDVCVISIIFGFVICLVLIIAIYLLLKCIIIYSSVGLKRVCDCVNNIFRRDHD